MICGSRSRRARSTRPTISRGWRTFSSTWRSTAARIQAGRADLPRSNRPARGWARTSTPTPASTRRCTCSSCRPTSDGIVAEGHAGAGRLRRRPDARSGRDRQGARRRHRGVARRARRRLAHARPADPGAVLQVEVRRAAADRQAGGPQELHAGAARAFYTKWYRPDRMAVVVVGDIDPRGDGGADPRRVRCAGEAGGRGRADRVYDVPLQAELLVKVATDPEAQQSSVSLVRKTAADCRRTASPTTGGTSCSGSCTRCSTSGSTSCRASRTRSFSARARTKAAEPDGGDRSASAPAVEEGKIAGRALGPGDRIQPGEGVRLRRGGAGAREEVDARRRTSAPTTSATRARADRSPRNTSVTSSRASRARASSTSTGCAKALIPASPPRRSTLRPGRCSRDNSRVILAVSPQKDGLAVPTEARAARRAGKAGDGRR